VFLRDNSGVHDGGSITLDPNTHWSTAASGGSGIGTFTPEPYNITSVKPGKAWNYGHSGDYMAYINARADLGRNVTVVADYAGFKATTNLSFTPDAKLAH
jgi:hypothetical protein